MTQKAVDFHVNGNDPNLTGLKNMLQGVGMYMDDRTLTVTEKLIVTVQTERSDVAAILHAFAKRSHHKASLAQVVNAEEKPKRKYTKRAQAEV